MTHEALDVGIGTVHFVDDIQSTDELITAFHAWLGSFEAVDDQTEMICRFDRDFRLTFANAAYRAAFERPGQDLIGSFSVPPAVAVVAEGFWAAKQGLEAAMKELHTES